MKQFYVYILFSESANRYYIGQTNNFNYRLKRHNQGYVSSTKPNRPWVMRFSLEVPTRKDAMKVEKYLKNLKSHKRLEEWIRKKEK